MHIRTIIVGVVAAGAVTTSALAISAERSTANTPWATAAMHNASGTRIGTVSFAADGARTAVTVRIPLTNNVAPSAFHGMHIHANDVTTNGDGCIADPTQPSNTWFVSADGHWKRTATDIHGQHAGDLPSLYVNADGTTVMRFVLDKLTAAEVVGKAVILHAGPDNFANVPVGTADDQYTAGLTALAKTQATGNAGDRVACGVIATVTT